MKTRNNSSIPCENLLQIKYINRLDDWIFCFHFRIDEFGPTGYVNFSKNLVYADPYPFLAKIIAKVRVENEFSSIHPQENGIPQGYPLSGTFFLIAINNITKIIQPPFRTILFSDDRSVHWRSSNPSRAYRILQSMLHTIHSWLSERGFRISIQKTQFITFRKPRTKLTSLPQP